MFTVESKITTVITLSTDKKEEIERSLDRTLELLERTLRNQHNYTEVPSVCPIMTEYILARVVAEEVRQDRFSLVSLLERVISFGVTFEKLPNTQFCSRVPP